MRLAPVGIDQGVLVPFAFLNCVAHSPGEGRRQDLVVGHGDDLRRGVVSHDPLGEPLRGVGLAVPRRHVHHHEPLVVRPPEGLQLVAEVLQVGLVVGVEVGRHQAAVPPQMAAGEMDGCETVDGAVHLGRPVRLPHFVASYNAMSCSSVIPCRGSFLISMRACEEVSMRSVCPRYCFPSQMAIRESPLFMMAL